SESQKLRNRIFGLSRALVTLSIAHQFDSVPLDAGKEVLVIWMIASSQVHSFKGKVPVRLGDKTTDANTQQLSELAQRKSHLDWLNQPCPGATLNVIDFFAVGEITRFCRRAWQWTAMKFRENWSTIQVPCPLPGQIKTRSASPVVPM